MACNPARFARLPIPDQQKQLLSAFSADPANDVISTQLCQASDEEIVRVAAKLAPPQGQAQGEPLQQQGIGALPGGTPPVPQNPQGPSPRGIPPGQLADVPRPMDTPSGGQGNAGLGGLLGRGR